MLLSHLTSHSVCQSLPMFWGDHALAVCKEIGTAHHRTDREKRVSQILFVLEKLAEVMTDVRSSSLTPNLQVDKASWLSWSCPYQLLKHDLFVLHTGITKDGSRRPKVSYPQERLLAFVVCLDSRLSRRFASITRQLCLRFCVCGRITFTYIWQKNTHFWGWGLFDTWTRKRTVSDLVLLVYYEPFKRELFCWAAKWSMWAGYGDVSCVWDSILQFTSSHWVTECRFFQGDSFLSLSYPIQ